MEKTNLMSPILGIIFLVSVAIMVYVLRRKDERKVFRGYSKATKHDYLYAPRYRALIETNVGNVGQTNLIYVYILDDEIVLHKEGIFAVSYYAIRFNPSNLIVLKYKRISKLKTKLIIYHTEKEMHSPYKVLMTSCMKDEAFEMLDRLCERVRNNDC